MIDPGEPLPRSYNTLGDRDAQPRPFKARDAQVPNRIPFEVITAAA
jgi:hypothetical protein